ncbi:uncharacterized protein LOC130975657 [Arachis stenosperma]|uniref:uncharacterized protein LOC130975657 n=1 Tax=Arachis stenosperma TaxID=217475 RepID=UPI0025ABB4CA|nr:uncharacterized protein LOC130975657 [Arachis stenosperma]
MLTSNPGSTVQVGVIPMPEGPPQFERFYVCLDACKKGFKAGCRPMIGLDGAFLKTLHGGQILTACAQDANNHIFVVAYAIVDVKNKDNWKWFLDLLQLDLGNYNDNKLCIISDMQKGLIPAVKEVMPMAQHRFCVWHLWQNFSKQWGITELKDLVWECARSRTRNEFERNMKRVKVINEQAWQYLEKWPKEVWTKAYFSEDPKNDNICNNACESFNAKIKHERTKPILTLAEEQSRLEAMTKLSSHWAPQWCGDEKEEFFEVHGWPTNMVVDLGKHTCTCRFWQLTRMPCMHAISAIQDKNSKRTEEYCHELLTMEATRSVGENILTCPCPTPPIKPKPGRPTKKRRKDKGEQPIGSSTKMKRKYNPIRCMFCGEVGHNKRSCAKKKKEDAEEQARQMQLQLALAKGPALPTDEPHTNNEVQSHSPPPPPVQPQPVVKVNQLGGTQPMQDTQLPVQDI